MSLSASHIIGGYIQYRHLGGNTYEVTLTIYRDCYYGGPGFDNPAFVGIYRSNGTLYQTLSIADPVIRKLDPNLQNPCVVVPKTICVQEGVYKDTVHLPSATGGYDLVYQRCCRNRTILNILSPNLTGATYTAHIPGHNQVIGRNSSPIFNQFPPIAICVGESLIVDQSAIDPDGDSLSYALCTPLNGRTSNQAQPNPPPPPPHSTVTYTNGYSAAYPLASNPPLAIDPVTGWLTGHPILQGQFVVGICVTEYRNGQVINTYLRDFQFNVIQCQEMAAIAPVIDTLYCKPYRVRFVNRSQNATQYDWDFGDPTTQQDKSLQFEPSYTYPDTGIYQVRLIARNNYGCIDTAYTQVTIRDGAQADFVFSAPCKNPDLIFTDLSQAYKGQINSWLWDFGNGQTSSQQFPRHTFPNAGKHPVSLTIMTDSGCTASVSRDVTFKPAPIANMVSGEGCVGETIRFEDSSTSNVSPIFYRKWTINGQSSINTTSLSRQFSQPGTYPAQLLVINDAGCQDSITDWITIHPNPTVHIQGDSLICKGTHTTLTASGAAVYQWLPSQDTSSTVTVSPAQNTTYTVTAIDSHGCKASISHTIQLAPPLPLQVQHNGPVCPGDSVTLQAQTPGQVEWWIAGQQAGQGKQLYLPLTQSTTVVAQATSVLGCKVTDTVALTTLPKPKAQVMPTQSTICEGNTVALLASGGSQYLWSPAIDLSCTQCPNPLVTPTASRQYTVTVSNQHQCTSTDSVAITFYPKVSVSLSYDSVVCLGDTALVGLAGLQAVQWQPAAAFSCDTCLSTAALFNNTTLVKAQYTDPNGCPGDTSFPITILPAPQLSITPHQPYVCIGDHVQLQVAGVTNAVWQPHPSLSCFTCVDPVASPTVDTDYWLTGTNSFGCSKDTLVRISVKPLPDPDLMHDTTICPGDSVRLESRAGQSWDWTTNHQALRCLTCQSTWVKPSIPISVQVNVSDQWGCKGQDSVFIGLLPVPDLQLSVPDTLCPGDTAFVQYNPTLLSIALLPARNMTLIEKGKLMLIPEQTTRYTLRGLGQNGCSGAQWFTLYHAPMPVADAGPTITAYPYQPVQLKGYATGQFAWQPFDSLSDPYSLTPTVQIAQRQSFTLTTQSAFGCRAQDEVWVEITPLPTLLIPNAFSPNGDGHNDLFTVTLPGDYVLETFQVFDRWGQLIHESPSVIEWDGHHLQQPLPTGVYMYRLVYGTPYGFPRERKGNITLLK